MKLSSLIVPSLMYSDGEDNICDATFIDNSASKSVTPSSSSTRSERDHAFDKLQVH